MRTARWGDVAVKFSPFIEHHDVRHEAMFHALTGAGAPVLHVDASGRRGPWLAARWIEGETLAESFELLSAPRRRSLLAEIGGSLRAAHDRSPRCVGYGLTAERQAARVIRRGCSDTPLRGGAPDWHTRFVPNIRWLAVPDESRRVIPDGLRTLARRELSSPPRGGREPLVLHGDLSPGNMLHRNGHLETLLDGAGVLGPRADDWACLLLGLLGRGRLSMGEVAETFGAFLDGYGPTARAAWFREGPFYFAWHASRRLEPLVRSRRFDDATMIARRLDECARSEIIRAI